MLLLLPFRVTNVKQTKRDIGENYLQTMQYRLQITAVAIAGDIRKAFLQVRIRAEDRDALRFHWISGENTEQLRTLRVTRALFGLGPSPFLLGGVIQHLQA